MNCIIGSDSAGCRLLEELVGKSSSLNLVGVFNNSLSIRNELSKRQDINLIIIDIEILSNEDFDFIESLDYKPNIIVISSSDQFALKAFELNIVDYLLKPISYGRFYKAIDKAIRYFSPKKQANLEDEVIFIKKGSTLIKIKKRDVIYIEALENYITLYTSNEKFIIHFTMKAIENQLPSNTFIRVQRSFIVNKSMIQVIKENSLDLIVGNTIKNVPIGKSYRVLLLDGINVMSR